MTASESDFELSLSVDRDIIFEEEMAVCMPILPLPGKVRVAVFGLDLTRSIASAQMVHGSTGANGSRHMTTTSRDEATTVWRP